MSRYDERSGPTRLYIGHISRRTRSRDLEDIFAKYGRIRDVDMKHDFAFVDFSDSRDADDARHYLNGRTVDGSRIVVEFAKRGPRGSGGGRDGGRDGGRHYVGRGPTPGTGRCYNCGHDGHWARDCKAGDWKNKCYRCGQRGHIERNCHNSPRANTNVSRSRSRSPVGGRRRSRSRSYSPRRRSYSRSPRKDVAKSSEPNQKKLLHSDSRNRSRSARHRNNREKSERSLSRSQSGSRSRSPPQRKRSYSPPHHNGENPQRSPVSPHLSGHNSPQDNNDHNGKSPDDDHLNNSRSPLHADDGGRNRSVGRSPIHDAELQDYTSPAENGHSPGQSGQSQESAE